MLELYHSALSVCSSKVRFALAAKQLPYTSRELNMQAGEHQSPSYLLLNPNAVVPTLVHDGNVVIESTVINEYLEDAFAARPLRPDSALDRARMRQWTRQLDDGIHEMTSVISFAIAYRHFLIRKTPEELARHYAGIPDAARRARIRDVVDNGVRAAHVPDALRRFDKLIADMNSALAARGPWLAGETFSLADVGFAPYITRLAHLQLAWLWGSRPAVAAWFAQVSARADYASSHTEWLATHPEVIELMRRTGTESESTLRELLGAR